MSYTTQWEPSGYVRRCYKGADNLHVKIEYLDGAADRTTRWRDLAHAMYEHVYLAREDSELIDFDQWINRLDDIIHARDCYAIYVSDQRTGTLLATSLIHVSESIHYGTVLSVTASINVGGAKCNRLLIDAYNFIGKINGIRYYVRCAYKSKGRYEQIYKELKWEA